MIPLSKHKYLSEDEYKSLLYQARVRRHAHAHRDYAIFLIAGLCGLRCAELIELRLGDVFLNASTPYVRVRSAKKRRYEQIDLPIQSRIVKALRKYLSDAQLKNPWDRLFRLSSRQLRRLFKFYGKLAGLSKELSFHSLRHFRGIQVFDQTKDIQLTKDALRHASITTTQIYVHTVDMSRLAKIDLAEDD